MVKTNPNPYSDLIGNFPGLIYSKPQPADFTEIIKKCANTKRVFLELGSGSGNFLLEHAKLQPEALYIGSEIRFKRCVRTAEKGLRAGLNNFIVIQLDANLLLSALDNQIVDGVYINFPDPWEKRRWKKHRLVSSNLIKNIERILKRPGFIKIKTDHEEYFNHAKNIIDGTQAFQLSEFTKDLHQSPFQVDNVLTEFEQLFQSQQKNIYYLHYTHL